MEAAFLAEITETTQPDVAVLEALADTLAFHIAQLEDRAERIERLEAHTEELTRAVRQSQLRLGLSAQVIHASDTPTSCWTRRP